MLEAELESLRSEVAYLKGQVAALDQKLAFVQFLGEMQSGAGNGGVMQEPVLGGQETQRNVPHGGCVIPPGDAGDMLVWDHGDEKWMVLNIGTDNQVLTVNESEDAPEWADLPTMPDGTATNDILYWNESTEEWVVLAAPATTGHFFLKVEDGVLMWKEAEECPE